MAIKAATTIKYELDLEEIKQMLVRELNLEQHPAAPFVGEVTVRYNLITKQYTGAYADPRDNNSYQEVGSVTVTVESK